MKRIGIIFFVVGIFFASVAFLPLDIIPAYDISILLGMSEIKTRFAFGIASIISFIISGIIGIIGN
tara:strand:+ start:133 stop:330 length:198 start_codon:yes stop_codon:yes gene_type:complete